MPLTIFEAMKQSVNPFTVFMFKSIATSDMMFSMLPFVQKGGESFEYDREATLPTFEFVAPGHTSLVESTGTVDHVTVPKREGAGEFHIRNYAQENLDDQVSPEQVQTRMKFKAAGRTIAQDVITGANIDGFVVAAWQSGAYIDTLVAGPWIDSDRHGPGSIRYTHAGTLIAFRAPGDRDYGDDVVAAADGTFILFSFNLSKHVTVTLDVSDATGDLTNEITFTSSSDTFDGLEKIMHPNQVLPSDATDGDAMTLGLLERLLDQVKVRENLAYVMPAVLRRKVNTLLRAGGGVDMVQLQNGSLVPSFNGIPILTNDFIPVNEAKGASTTLSSAYLLSLTPDEGVYMGALGGPRFVVDADPRDATVLGFRLYDLGQITGVNAFGKRLAYYGGLAMGSYLSCARQTEIITA